MSITHINSEVTEVGGSEMEAIAKRAAKTARLLDQKKPGWEKKVDLKTLKMEETGFCVIGQVYGDYYEVDLSELGAPDYRYGLNTRNAWAFKRALCINPSCFYSSLPAERRWKELANIWKELIEERLAKASLPSFQVI